MSNILQWERGNTYYRGQFAIFKGLVFEAQVDLVSDKEPDQTSNWIYVGLSNTIIPTTAEFISVNLEAYNALVDEVRHLRTKQGEKEIIRDEEAVALLTQVCKQINWEKTNYPEAYGEIDDLADIEGMKEWWQKHRPKTEREEKIEKIATVLSLDGKSPTDELRIVAKRVLDAIS